MRQCGIYKISSPSGNFYIGSSVNIRGRWAQHKCDLRKGKHHSQPLQRAVTKYGLESLALEVLLECDRASIRQIEQWVIIALTPEYNTTDSVNSPFDTLWQDPAFKAMKIKNSSDTMRLLMACPQHQEKAHEGRRRRVREDPELRARLAANAKRIGKDPSIIKRRAKTNSNRYKNDPEYQMRRRNAMRAMWKDQTHRDRQRAGAQALWKDEVFRARNKAACQLACGKRVQCVETGEVFPSMSAAARNFGGSASSVKAVIDGDLRAWKGRTFVLAARSDATTGVG